uniref:Uncharacterized protein n=1 Tax=Cuerna arida TaxID=1464854 RepID=A0A1B6GKL3_9HEMI
MAEGSGQENTVAKTKKKQKSKMDFDSIYEQLQEENSVFIDNKEFWTRKGNSQKYTCTLCNISVQISSNMKLVKTVLLNHIEDKYHRKRYDNYMSNRKSKDDDKFQEQIPKLQVNDDTCNNKNNEDNVVSDVKCFRETEINKCVVTEDKDEMLKKAFEGIDIVKHLGKVYKELEEINPVTNSSKKFIKKGKEDIHYFCTLCEESILNSINSNKLKYNLWVHINSENHIKKLPNFSKIQRDFNLKIETLFKNLPSSLKGDLKYFEMGSVFRFVKCTLCDTAVSENAHRFENHIRGEEHVEKRKIISSGIGSFDQEPLSERNRKVFRKLIAQIEDKFKKDIKYIQIGKIPGYVICRLCASVVLPTQFYVQSHFERPNHVKNRNQDDQSKHKVEVNLENLMSSLPNDLKDYNIFEENSSCITCRRCNESLPATSYDLYCHIMKERQKYL